jgi:hypothetical protein
VLVREGSIDEAAGTERERLPIKRLGQDRWYDGAQRATGVLGLAEHCFEQRIVWGGDHRRRERRSAARQGQDLAQFTQGAASMDKNTESKLSIPVMPSLSRP